jgi:mannose-6-phosphate isomerase-like protein (cupin superfamily)
VNIHDLKRREPDAIAPDGSEIYVIVGDADRASLVEVVLAAGEISRPIRHRTVEEIWHVLAGSGEMWLKDADSGDTTTHKIGPGSTVLIRTGYHFQFRSSGSGGLRILCYTSPPWPGPDEAVDVEAGAWPPTVGTTESS